MAVDVVRVEGELLELRLAPGDDAGEVHHLRQPDHAPPPEQALEVAWQQAAPGGFEVRGRHAGRGHEEDVQRQVVAEVGEPVHSVRPEDVGDLVGVGDHRCRAEGEDEAGQLVHEQLHGLDVHVGVDEARDEELAIRVQDLVRLVFTEPRDVAVDDRQVALQPLAREDREDPSSADDEVGGLVATGYGETACKVRHCRENVLGLAAWKC